MDSVQQVKQTISRWNHRTQHVVRKHATLGLFLIGILALFLFYYFDSQKDICPTQRWLWYSVIIASFGSAFMSYKIEARQL